jgi:hypothetical protein
MPRLQLGLRDLFWMILAVGLCIAWLGDRYETQRMEQTLATYEAQYHVKREQAHFHAAQARVRVLMIQRALSESSSGSESIPSPVEPAPCE